MGLCHVVRKKAECWEVFGTFSGGKAVLIFLWRPLVSVSVIFGLQQVTCDF